jgi:hypothetical protein
MAKTAPKRHRFHQIINVFLIYSPLPEINLKSIEKAGAEQKNPYDSQKKTKSFLNNNEKS